MSGSSGGATGRGGRRTLAWATFVVLAFAGALLGGLSAVALLAASSTDTDWTVRANVGESLGAVLSALALAALIVTFWVQFNELRSQREDLAAQNRSLSHTHRELHRSAETEMRRMHHELIKLAIDDADLARVWPIGQRDLPYERVKQYLYANLTIQHTRLYSKIGDDAEMENYVRYLFTSPLIREFWVDTVSMRAGQLAVGTEEFLFARLADAVCEEYDSVFNRCPQTLNGQRCQAWRSSTSVAV